MEKITENAIFQYEFFGNSVQDYLVFLVAFIALLVVFRVVQGLVLRHLRKLSKRTETDVDDTLIEIVKSIKPPFYSFLAFYLALKFVAVNDHLWSIVRAILIIWVVYQIIVVFELLLDYVLRKYISKDGKGAKGAASGVKLIVNIGLWSVGIILVLSNMGVNVTSLVAGLGIGGIAIAFALQNILSDLFSSFAIFFDKPFVEGDFIVAGNHMGTVEKVGIKTTRLRALQGEQIVISNKELTSSRIQNYRRMTKRGIIFTLGVTYETPNEKLRKIPEMIKKIIDSIDETEFKRAHFKSFDDSALKFQIFYFVTNKDYNVYMDVQQEINFKIKESFEKENISMAYPTRTLYMHSDK